MARKVQVAGGLSLVQLPNGLPYKAGDQVILTDLQYAQLPASSLDGNPLIDLGPVGEAGDASVAQAANVAAIATADGTDPATTQALANATKSKVNALLAALTGAGKPMAP